MNAPSPEAPRDLRDTILAVATKLFADQGYAGTSIRQIVEASNCTNPSLYYYFSSKEDLFRKVVEAQLETITSFLREWGQHDGSLRSRLNTALVEFLEFGRTHPETFRLLQRLELNTDDSAPLVDIATTRSLHVQLIANIVSQGIASGEIRPSVDPTLAALALAGIVHFHLQHALCTGAWNLELVQQTLDLLFDGIAA